MVLRCHNFVYKEHGSSKGVHDQPCESTGLTVRHARTKTQQIGHLKGKKTNPSMSLCASVSMCFVVTCWVRADLLALVCGV